MIVCHAGPCERIEGLDDVKNFTFLSLAFELIGLLVKGLVLGVLTLKHMYYPLSCGQSVTHERASEPP